MTKTPPPRERKEFQQSEAKPHLKISDMYRRKNAIDENEQAQHMECNSDLLRTFSRLAVHGVQTNHRVCEARIQGGNGNGSDSAAASSSWVWRYHPLLCPAEKQCIQRMRRENGESGAESELQGGQEWSTLAVRSSDCHRLPAQSSRTPQRTAEQFACRIGCRVRGV